jgi:hypothetical protein
VPTLIVVITRQRWATRTVVATACAVMPLAATAPAHASPSYGSNGVFGVNADAAAGWATTFIPPGRYRVDQSPSMYPYLSPPGYWLRCSAFPCAGNLPGHVIATGQAVRDAPTFVDILPSDAGVSLSNVTLTIAG